MNKLELTGLNGSNPLAFLAALGVLAAVNEAAQRCDPGVPEPRLSWVISGTWRPVLHCHLTDDAALIDCLEADRLSCCEEPALRFTYPDKDEPKADLKPTPAYLAQTLRTWVEAARPAHRRTLDWFSAFVAEGANDNNGNAKPTALHFTAGQQRFLKSACDLVEGTGPDHLRVAVFGPWNPVSTLPVMGWDNTETRDYALRASNPSTDKKVGEPGADWLALRGLGLLTVNSHRGEQRTPGVRGRWKDSTFAWPMWTPPATEATTRALLATPNLRSLNGTTRARRGIALVFESQVLRSDQGGYGSMTPAAVV